jgi:hypothetical protein
MIDEPASSEPSAMSDPLQFLEEIQQATIRTADLLQSSVDLQERIARLAAGAVAAQTATVGLMIQANLISARQAVDYFRGMLETMQKAGQGPESHVIRSILDFMEDTYGLTPVAEGPGRRTGPHLSVLPGGKSDGEDCG